MTFDVSSIQFSSALMGLEEPNKPIKISTNTTIALNPGEDQTEYNSFLQVVNDLGQALKFFSKNTGATWQSDLKKLYTNLDVNPSANEWNLINGEQTNADGSSILDEINSYFDWSTIENVGGSKSYYDIANSDISSMTPEEAFDLMCSMVESKERVYAAFKEIFGDDLSDEAAVKQHITDFLSQYSEVDPHNLSLLNYFYNMESDFVNSIDSYINCETFWGGTTGGGSVLMNKVNSYISGLSGDQATAAGSLEGMWTDNTKWNVDPTGVTDDTSWVSFFKDQIKTLTNQDSVKYIVAGMLNRMATNEYNAKEADYKTQKDDRIYQEVEDRKVADKRRSESKKLFQKMLSKSSSMAKTLKSRTKKASSSKPTRSTTKQTQQASAQKTALKHTQNLTTASLSSVKKHASSTSASSTPVAFNPMAAHNQNEQKKKKVI